MSKPHRLPVRLCIREEGSMVNAYLADNDSMKGAIHIGSIAVAAVIDNKERWETFKGLMSSFVSAVLEENLGSKPHMVEREVSEREKPGNC